jgi:hypothetical protein
MLVKYIVITSRISNVSRKKCIFEKVMSVSIVSERVQKYKIQPAPE